MKVVKTQPRRPERTVIRNRADTADRNTTNWGNTATFITAAADKGVREVRKSYFV